MQEQGILVKLINDGYSQTNEQLMWPKKVVVVGR
jgi:hypothetical protein